MQIWHEKKHAEIEARKLMTFGRLFGGGRGVSNYADSAERDSGLITPCSPCGGAANILRLRPCRRPPLTAAGLLAAGLLACWLATCWSACWLAGLLAGLLVGLPADFDWQDGHAGLAGGWTKIVVFLDVCFQVVVFSISLLTFYNHNCPFGDGHAHFWFSNL